MDNQGKIKRVFLAIHQFLPKMLPTLIFLAVVTIIRPYYASSLLALLVDAFTKLASLKTIMTLVALLCLGMFGINLLIAWLTGESSILKGKLQIDFAQAVTSKMLTMDYERLESPDVVAMRTKGISALTYNNTLNKVIDGLFTGSLNIVISLALTMVTIFNLFATHTQQATTAARFTNSPWYDVSLICALIIPIVVSIILTKRNKKIQQQNMATNVQFNQRGRYFDNQVLLADDSGEVFRAFNSGPVFLDWITENFKAKPMRNLVDGSYKLAVNTALLQAVILLATTVLYLLVAVKAYVGAISLGQIILYVSYLQAFITVMNTNLMQWNDGLAVLDYLDTLVRFIHLPAEDQDADQNELVKTTAPTLTFEHVWFRYHTNDDWLLKDLNFSLNPGMSVALVGKNGAGKTTLVKILCRLYHPVKGRILLDGQDIQTLDAASYRRLLAVVFQDFKLLAYPIDQNIAASHIVDRQRLQTTVQVTGIAEWLANLPNGDATWFGNELSSQGRLFSGGEQQKIAIARAHYQHASVLILDEPTAALDPQSEFEVYQNLQQLVKGKSALFISHRMGSCRFCERIIVLDHGQIIQDGTHQQLLKQPGLYAELFQAQAQYYQTE